MLLLSYVMIQLGYTFAIIGIVSFFKRKTKENIIYPLQGFLGIEVFTIFFSVMLSIFIKINVTDTKSINLFTAFVLWGVVAISNYVHSIIYYDSTGFYIYNLLCIKKRYEFADIVYLKQKTLEYKYGGVEERVTIKMPKRKIIINRQYANYFEFMNTMASAYKKAHNCKIPKKN